MDPWIYHFRSGQNTGLDLNNAKGYQEDIKIVNPSGGYMIQIDGGGGGMGLVWW